MNVLPVSDMSNTFPEHSMVTGFLATACSISGERIVVPDVSIICNIRGQKE